MSGKMSPTRAVEKVKKKIEHAEYLGHGKTCFGVLPRLACAVGGGHDPYVDI